MKSLKTAVLLSLVAIAIAVSYRFWPSPDDNAAIRSRIARLREKVEWARKEMPALRRPGQVEDHSVDAAQSFANLLSIPLRHENWHTTRACWSMCDTGSWFRRLRALIESTPVAICRKGSERPTIRHRQRRQAHEPLAVRAVEMDGLTGPNDLEQFWDQDHRQYLVGRALELMRAEFQPTTWQACWEHVFRGRPVAEVAAELGLSENAVYIAKLRVLRRLRQELQGLLD